jgi:glutamine---fructose-6-phosphate transaminase (isomerizing)
MSSFETIGTYTYKEIMSQGEVWQKVLLNAEDQFEKVRDLMFRKHDEVIFIGCGSTYYLSLSAAKIWTALTNEPARGMPSSEAWIYGETNFSRNTPLLVAVSRSGETTETINAINTFKQMYGDNILVISCYPDSNMVGSTTYTLLSPDAQENSVAQTRSFSSMYVMSHLLAGYYSNKTSHIEELSQLPSLFSQVVEKYEPLIKNIATDLKYDHFVFLGSGINYGLASEVMLKMKEMSKSVSEAFHFMEFRHGPMSMITDRSLVIGLVSENNKKEELRVLQDMKKLGATTLALVNSGTDVNADFVVEFDSRISDLAQSTMRLPLLQLLGYYHSLCKGLNPDQPTNLTAVVSL